MPLFLINQTQTVISKVFLSIKFIAYVPVINGIIRSRGNFQFHIRLHFYRIDPINLQCSFVISDPAARETLLSVHIHTINTHARIARPSRMVLVGAYLSRLVGTPNNFGPKIYGISGHVKRPGAYEFPMGTRLETLLDAAGGVIGRLKAVIVGGLSVPILTAREAEGLVMDHDSCLKRGTMLGSGGVIVINETASIPRIALRTIRFYAHESCGQCTPCRQGSHTLAALLDRLVAGRGAVADIDLILQLCARIKGSTLCPTGEALAMPIEAMVTKFRGEFEALVSGAVRIQSPDALVWADSALYFLNERRAELFGAVRVKRESLDIDFGEMPAETLRYDAGSFDCMDTCIIATRILQEHGYNPSTMASFALKGEDEESHMWLSISDGLGRFAFVETGAFASGRPVIGELVEEEESGNYSSGYVLVSPMKVLECFGYSEERFLSHLKAVERTSAAPIIARPEKRDEKRSGWNYQTG